MLCTANPSWQDSQQPCPCPQESAWSCKQSASESAASTQNCQHWLMWMTLNHINCALHLLYSFIHKDIYIAPLENSYSEALPTPAWLNSTVFNLVSTVSYSTCPRVTRSRPQSRLPWWLCEHHPFASHMSTHPLEGWKLFWMGENYFVQDSPPALSSSFSKAILGSVNSMGALQPESYGGGLPAVATSYFHGHDSLFLDRQLGISG